MTDLHDMERRALEYIRNAGGTPQIDWFDEDHGSIDLAHRRAERLYEALNWNSRALSTDIKSWSRE